MGAFVLRRLAHGLIVVLGVTVFVFIVTRLVGDPVSVMLPIDASETQRAAFTHSLGLDRPIAAQLVTFAQNVVQLDFGDSLWQQRPAMSIVLERVPATFELVFTGMLLAALIAVPAGIIAALRPGGAVDRIATTLSVLTFSLPQYWLGLLFIVLFSVDLGWLPTSGNDTPLHLVLPAVTLALPPAGRIAMVLRSTLLEELRKPYVRAVIAKGLPLWRVVGIHAGRNSGLPVLTIAGWELIRSVAGNSVLVETVFAWPGLGLLATQAIHRHDLILLQALVFAVAMIVVLINLVMDVLYKLIDPRIELA